MAGAAFVAWLGAALVVLADGRRGLALGLALLTVALAVLAWPAGMALGSVAIVVGGLVAAALCWRSGPASWAIMPAGSTPRLILCIASGLLALWVAASLTSGAGAPLRFAVLVVVGLMGARIQLSREPFIVLAAVAAFALALGLAPGLAGTASGPAVAVVGALIAVGVMFLPATRTSLPPPRAMPKAQKDGG